MAGIDQPRSDEGQVMAGSFELLRHHLESVGDHTGLRLYANAVKAVTLWLERHDPPTSNGKIDAQAAARLFGKNGMKQ